MKNKTPPDLNLLVRPYSFVLQEGKSIKSNYMDYSLRLFLGNPQYLQKKKKNHIAKNQFKTL